MKIAPLAAVLLAAAALAGCGASGGTSQVASLPISAASQPAGHTGSTDSTASNGATTPSGADTVPAGSGVSDDSGPIAGRPQFRLDDTDARRAALINAWSSCLIQHGAPKVDNSARVGAAAVAGQGGKPTMIEVGDPVPAAAKVACLHLLPVMPPEEEATTNPDFHAQSLAYVGCMRQKGLWVELLNDHDLDWTFMDGHSVPDDQATIEHDCLLQAFSS
jgi:hypothetical protein